MSIADSKARPPPQPPPLQPSAYKILIDCESVDAKHVLSEVSWLVISPSTDGKELQVIEAKHFLCKAVSGNVRPEDWGQAQYIYKNVTGLSFTTLMHHGKTYDECLKQVAELRTRFPDAKWLARDPRLEQILLKQDNIGEVLDYLVEPINKIFYHKVNREHDIEVQCFKNHYCGFHEALYSSPPRSPHCAQVDVYVMYEWLKKYGRHDQLGLISPAAPKLPRMPSPLMIPAQASIVPPFYLAWNQFASPPPFVPSLVYMSPSVVNIDPNRDQPPDK